jgi:UDP:flavonoid glycosyltransferase YjiC (YdhE family)
MRVLLSSTRGLGHIQPLLPYARALLRRGHQVLVAGPADLSEVLREAALEHAPFGHPGDDTLAPLWARLRGATPAEQMSIALQDIFAGANARAALPGLQQTIGTFKPDLVLRDSVEFGSLIAAERAGVAHARVAVHMVSFEEPGFPLATGPLDQLRQQVGLPAGGASFVRTEPAFSAFPASLDGPRDAGKTVEPHRARVVEQAASTVVPAWAPADEGSDDGKPLVYVTFGTVAGGTPGVRAVYRTAIEAVASLPVHALLTTGRGLPADALGSIPANVHVEAFVPQRDVLPRVRAVVCHGGSGTVLGALAAGVPMVVVPLFADQPHNAERVAAVGTGLALPAPDAASLAAAIGRLLAEPAFSQRARQLAGEVAAMPTVDDMIDVLSALTG